MSSHSKQERKETKVRTQQSKVSIMFDVFADIWLHICFMYDLCFDVEKHECSASEATQRLPTHKLIMLNFAEGRR